MIAIRKTRDLGCTVYTPTRKDIWQACREIQATWSPQDRAERSRGVRVGWWLPPSIRLSLFEAVIERGGSTLIHQERHNRDAFATN